jgi:VWFA-related protein
MRHAANQTFGKQLALAALLGIALAGVPQPGAAANSKDQEKGETVSLYLNVETNGKLVTGLAKENFRLYEDGRSRPFRLEKPEEPAAIAFLVEHSASSLYFMEDIAYALNGFVAHGIEGHWYALAAYANRLEIQQDFTKQIGDITQAYAQLGTPVWNEINTYDAVYEMLDKMGRLPGRRILIVIGSGIDTFSEHRLDDVKKKIESENVTVFAAGLGSLFRGAYDPFLTADAQMQLLQAQSFLGMLASKSGGFAWFPKMANAFRDVVEGMMQSISTQYRLVYNTEARGTGKFHKIKVEAFRVVDDKRENFKVLVREGWR